MSARIPNILSIAGTDPTGGAGIQADLKTFGALGTYGMAVVTAIVAQNTRAVTQVAAQPPALVAAQLDAVFCASSSITKALSSVRPRIKARGAISIMPASMKALSFS